MQMIMLSETVTLCQIGALGEPCGQELFPDCTVSVAFKIFYKALHPMAIGTQTYCEKISYA